MYVWTIGITDRSPTTWKSHEPLWEDEKLTASTSHTFHDVMNKLCQTAIKGRREYDDYAVHEHLWNMKIVSLEDAMNPRAAEERLLRMLDRDDESEDENGEHNHANNNNNNTIIQCPDEESRGGYEDFDDPNARVLNSNTKLSTSLLPKGRVITVTYDYGTTTMLYLKVLSVKEKAVESLLEYFSYEADSTEMVELLKAVPAYHLPPEKQVDSYFPCASKACLGYYVPLFTTGTGGSNSGGENRRVMGSLTFGLSGKLRSEKDIVFLSMEDRTQSRDVMFSPGIIEPNKLLQVIDKAWEPRDKSTDTDGLDRFRYDWINRWMVAADNDELYDDISEIIENDPGYGSKKLLFRLAKDRKSSGFDFEQVFPKTYAMLTCGKFRWFQYKKDVLRVVVGRGVGQDSRQCESKQILRTWKRDFKSFHEMLCAVEASWVWNGKELTADSMLPEFDTDLGPSRPLPKEPPCLGKEKDAIVVSACGDKKKLVTALAISEETGGKTVLYSGHDDGTLSKWSLDSNEQIWSKHIYADGTKDFTRYTSGVGLYVKETPGVTGIVVRPGKMNSKQPIVYTWTDAYNGYPEHKFDERGPSKLKVWSGIDGKYIQEYLCDVGKDEDGLNAHPSISTVVFCKVFHEDSDGFLDHIIVGLHCYYNSYEYDDSFSNFDRDDAEEACEGNIMPFLEHYPHKKLNTWRGQGGLIRAMAVVESERCILSLSICPGHGRPDELVLWSLSEPGIPLFKKSLYNQSRLDAVVGISVEGCDVLLADSYGDRIAAVTIEEDEDGDLLFEMQGYASIGCRYYDEGFHGRMAMSKSNYCVMAVENNQTAWIFPVDECSGHDNLDRREGNRKNFEKYFHEEDEDESLKEKRAGREMAIGKVRFPLWGGNKPERKKKRLFGMDIDDDSDGFGKGGPVRWQ